MAHYRLDLSYVGTNFQGWQTQPSRNSIQDHLQKALSIFLREDVSVIGSSRTDSGVHAEHQVASFKTDVLFERKKLLKGGNALLPKEIRIQKISIIHTRSTCTIRRSITTFKFCITTRTYICI